MNQYHSLFDAGNEIELREKILSIPLHCSNHHNFPNNVKHTACCHEDLTGEERDKPWLEEGSKVGVENKTFNLNNLNKFQELSKLQSALAGSDKSRLADLSMMTGTTKYIYICQNPILNLKLGLT